MNRSCDVVGSLVDPQTIESAEQRDLIERSNQLIVDARQCSLEEGGIESCVSMIADACGHYAAVFGECGVQCLKPYIYYATALLELGRREHSVMSSTGKDNVVVAAMEDDSMEPVEYPSVDSQDAPVADDKMDTEEGTTKISDEVVIVERESDNEAASDGTEEADDESNLRHALTMLDIAILICDRNMDASPQFASDKADCLLKKCQIYQEFDDFGQAVKAVEESLMLQSKITPPNLRMHAEGLYYAGMVFQNTEQYTKATEAYQRCIDTLKQRIVELRDPRDGETSDTCAEETKEIEECIADLEVKILDVKMSSDDRLLTHVKAVLSRKMPTTFKPVQSNGGAKMDVTSRLVRKPTNGKEPYDSASDVMED